MEKRALKEKKFLTREEILAIDDLPKEEVYVKAWDTYVYVRSMTAAERDLLEMSVLQDDSKGGKKVNLQNAKIRTISLTVCDVNGKALFTEADIAALGKKSAKAIEQLFAVSQRLSALGTDDMETALKN